MARTLRTGQRVVKALGLIVFATVCWTVQADGQSISFVRQFGTTAIDQAKAVASDGAAIYVGGFSQGDLVNGVTTPWISPYVRKYDNAGNILWTKQYGSLGMFGQVTGLAVNGTNIYAIGINQNGSFVVSLDAAGQELWSRVVDSEAAVFGVATDASGLYVAGETSEDGAFPGFSNSGSKDAFIRKYTHTGDEQWVTQFGSQGDDSGLAVVSDGANLYATGHYTGANGSWSFLRKMNGSTGAAQWMQIISSATTVESNAIALDGTGIYIGGKVAGALPGQVSLGGNSDAWIKKYDTLGLELWSKEIGTSADDAIYGLATDGTAFYAALHVVAGSAQAGEVRKLDQSGNPGWAATLPGSITIQPSGIAVSGGAIVASASAVGSVGGEAAIGSTDAVLVKITAQQTQTLEQMLTTLRNVVQSFNLKQGIANSLDSKLEHVEKALESARNNDLINACNRMNAFLSEVSAQTNKSITQAQADQLNSLASQIMVALGCTTQQ